MIVNILNQHAEWKAKIEPSTSTVSQFTFDVIIGADARKNTFEGEICYIVSLFDRLTTFLIAFTVVWNFDFIYTLFGVLDIANKNVINCKNLECCNNNFIEYKCTVFLIYKDTYILNLVYSDIDINNQR